MRTRTTDPRRAARIAAVGAVTLVAGFMPGTGAATDTRTAEADVAYTCDLPSGAQPVAVHIAAELPVTTSIGTAIRPRDVALSFELPRSVLSASPGAEPVAVSGSARMLTEVSQRGESTEVPWQGLEIPEFPLPATGDLSLRATGEVPTITPRSSGDVLFALGQLDVGPPRAPRRAPGTRHLRWPSRARPIRTRARNWPRSPFPRRAEPRRLPGPPPSRPGVPFPTGPAVRRPDGQRIRRRGACSHPPTARS